ncbi:CoA-disulfide reductase [Natroniella sulfidigena]|uniref:CoA-disulfide reductase n=1 Tax=Natroniella sulfidigena TaxID=723921 RepID=UPI00200A05A7|nr:CoA-disulfide reductase [Natroniella sulfidigena]MCK8817870.1 CoA-disulfide reductase [Natroniella sulfidigena]
MSKKVLIVGGVAGGASAAARLRRVDEEAEIILFEKGDYISFANCGLPYHIGEVIEERSDLLIQTPEAMEDRFNLEVRVKQEVVEIDSQEQQIKVKNLVANETYNEDYDYLLLAPGADPIRPPIPGIEGENIFSLRSIPDTDQIKEFVDQNQPEQAVVVGGGFIGLEMAENLVERGVDVAVVERGEQVMGPLDYEMAAIVHNHLREQGVKLYLNDGVTEFSKQEDKTRVKLDSERELEADLVLLAIGVSPSVELAEQAGLELGVTGGIKVDSYLQTSDQNIYAIGDVIEVEDYVTKKPAHIPLAGPANKQGRIVANNIAGRTEEYKGTQGTSVLKVFDLTVATTGSNEQRLTEAGIDYQVSYTNSKSHAGYYPNATSMTIKLLFTPTEGKLLGAQIVGQRGVDKRIDVLATALRYQKTVYDLQELELAYAPPFGSAKDPVNMAGYVAGNIVNGDVEVIQWDQVDELGEDVILLDVRREVELKFGALEGAINISLNSLRDRLDELDREREVVIYCAVGLRGYLASRILMQRGFKQVKNLSGGYKLYREVELDQTEKTASAEEKKLATASNPEEAEILD